MALARIVEADYADITLPPEGVPEFKSKDELDAFISKLESDMREAAKLRDQVRELKTKEFIFA